MISGLFVLLVIGGLGYAAFNGFGRLLDPHERAQLDATRVVRSGAVAVGLYLAMLAVTVGIIDLFQAIGAGTRIAGSDSDLARALSLLIVGGPAFVVLLRLISQWQRQRSATGADLPQLGWTLHLIAALTTALVGSLVSIGQIIDDLTSSLDVEATEVAQLAGWLLVWALYWFVLRPRFGVRGHVHVAIGTIIGLGWTVAGLIGLGVDLGGQAYRNLFETSIDSAGEPVAWALVGLVGAATWWWHWRVLHRDTGGVEEPGRHTDTWFAVVVGFGIVPALIALLVAAGGAVAAVLIWFLGSVDESAVDYFEPAAAAIVVVLVALAVWAFHRMQLQPVERVRNEAIRFHDYAVVSVGLVAVVTGLALLVNLVFEALGAGGLIASGLGIDNRLIATLVLLAVGSGVWWRTWGRIERARQHNALAEANSIWRKLYLIVAAGVGGLVLAIAAIWVLFTVLRDLFDGLLGSDTVSDLAGPIGWLVAVVAGVWFHLGVWRSDRTLLAAAAPTIDLPPPPPPPPAGEPDAVGTQFRWAEPQDHGELFTLQRASFVDEAHAYATPEVPALVETFEAFRERTASINTLVATDAHRIVGAVGVRRHDDKLWLERLMVAPDRRHEGLGGELVEAIVSWIAWGGGAELRAVVGDRDTRLPAFYTALGFALIGRTASTATAPELLVMARMVDPSPGADAVD